MNREVHVRNCEGVGVKLPRATRLFKFYQYILGEVAMTTYTDYFDARR